MQYPHPTPRWKASLALLALSALTACGGGGGGGGGGSGGGGSAAGGAPTSVVGSSVQDAGFAVHAPAAGDQYGSQAARLTDGSFIVVWSSIVGGGAAEVRMRRLDPQGAPLGPEQSVAPSGSNAQVTAFADGRFLVTWRVSPFIYSVVSRGQLYDAQGQRAGGTLELGAGFNSFSGQPTALPDGGFVFVAEANMGRYAETYTVVRRFEADGAVVGSSELHSTLLPTTTAYDQNHAGRGTSTVLADGRFAVAWTAFGSAANELRLSLFDPQGAPLGGHQVITSGAGVENASIAALPSGGFAVAWESGQPQQDRRATLAAFDAAGQPIAQRELANEAGAHSIIPAVVALADGRLGVSWRIVRYGERSALRELWAQRFDAGANAVDAAARLADLNHPYGTPGGTQGMAAAGAGFLVVYDLWTPATGSDVRGTVR